MLLIQYAATRLHMAELQQAEKIILPAQYLWQNSPICNFSACASQQSATHAIPSQPDTLALVLYCSYSDPHVVYHRLVYTYKTKLH